MVGENHSFDFQTSQRILFGSGRIDQLASITSEFGKRVYWFSISRRSFHDSIEQSLKEAGVTFQMAVVQGEPKLNQILAFVDEVKEFHPEVVVATGGGSVLDCAKAVAALAVNPGDPLDYLEVVGKGKPLQVDPLPVIAIPTTAGTGSEVTRNAVISLPEHQLKVSLRSPKMLPSVALIDPTLMLGLPPNATASTGMDALTQVIEPYVSIRANAFTDLFCEGGIRKIARSLRTAYHRGDDLAAREDMAFGSLMGGLALANAGLGAVHGFAAPLGGLFDAPHGAICARLLPVVCQVNIQALQERSPHNPVLERYQKIAGWLTGNPDANPLMGVRWLEELCEELQIPRLREYGVQRNIFSRVVENAKRASSMKANPLELRDEELFRILEEAY
ncbi:MAG: iron-containing alcohol dehydrogenase [Bellilinea sp.]|nr:iron-containing alcohol dehydrogenase [Bellilinea sp.]